MLVLGIESTCDETAAAVVRNGNEIYSNVIASQHDIHSKFGGVFPELASRRHLDVVIPLVKQALEKASVTLKEIDLIAVAKGPGLLGSLLVGLNTAKTLAFACKKPFIGINHVEAHLFAALMSHKTQISFPSLGIVLSGGHTNIVKINDIGSYEPIAATVDDAIGEAFDKVAKVIGEPYPGGPKIEQLAKKGDPYRFPFKPGQIKASPLNFSFSGIKTAVLYTVKGQNANQKCENLSLSMKCDIAASFQRVVFEDVIEKTLKAVERNQSKTLVFGGGVTNNCCLREMFAKKTPHLDIYWPSAGLSLDNAAMIAGLGYHKYLQHGSSHFDLEAETRMPLS